MLLLLAASAHPARAQVTFCEYKPQLKEVHPGLYFEYLFVGDKSLGLYTATYPSPDQLEVFGNNLEAGAPSSRFQPVYGKCDPVTDRVLLDIRNLFSAPASTVSGSATGGGIAAGAGASAPVFRSAAADQDVVVGFSDRGNFTPFHAFRWTLASGSVDLGTLDPANNATRTSMATATNANGSVIVGFSEVSAAPTLHAFRWTSAGMVDLGAPAGATNDSRATGVSAAGDVIVGDATFADQNAFSGFRSGAFRWTAAGGFQNLGALEPGFFSIATRVSADGNTVVGQGGVQVMVGNTSTNGSRAFRWTSASGMQAIGPLPGHTHAVATGVSDNGKVVVGISSTGPLSYNSGGGAPLGYGTGTAFIWTESGGLRALRQDLVSGAFSLAGVTFVTAAGIAGDGQFIVGQAVTPNTPNGETGSYILKRCDVANGVPCAAFKPAPAAADFTFGNSGAAFATVAAGQQLTATLSITPSGGFNQAVTFACAGLPAATACTFAPPTVTPNSTTVTTTLTISTTAPARGAAFSIDTRRMRTPTGSIVAAAAIVCVLGSVGASTRRHRMFTLVRVSVGAMAIGACMSCGGGSGSDGGTTEPPPTGGTKPGTYPIVISATSGTGVSAISKSLTFTMTVTQ